MATQSLSAPPSPLYICGCEFILCFLSQMYDSTFRVSLCNVVVDDDKVERKVDGFVSLFIVVSCLLAFFFVSCTT
jgi:hypothetical protein